MTDRRMAVGGAPRDSTAYTMADSFNTGLSPALEDSFIAWVLSGGRDPAAETTDYDLRGYWSDPEISAEDKDSFLRWETHAPDTYKKPSHPTFSTDSKYSTPERPGGTWLPHDLFVPHGAPTPVPTRSVDKSKVDMILRLLMTRGPR